MGWLANSTKLHRVVVGGCGRSLKCRQAAQWVTLLIGNKERGGGALKEDYTAYFKLEVNRRNSSWSEAAGIIVDNKWIYYNVRMVFVEWA